MSSRPIRLGRFDVESPEWLAHRRAGVGGSDVAPILGLSPFNSAFSLWHRKAGTIPDDPLDGELIYWGHTLESIILARWRAEHPEYGAAKWQGSTWAHPDQQWRHANPDFVAHIDRRHEPVEIKNIAYGDDWGPSGTTEVPIWYLCQLLWYCDVLGCRYGWLAVLIGGRDYREYRIDTRDHQDDLQLIRDQTAAFWASVQDGIPPSIDDSDATYQTIRALHPDIEDIQVEIPSHLAVELVHAHQGKKTAEAAMSGALARVADAMGSARHATVNGLRVASRRSTVRNGEWTTPFLVVDRNAATNLATIKETP